MNRNRFFRFMAPEGDGSGGGGTPPAGTPPAGTPPAGTPPAGTPPPGPIAWHPTADADTVGYVQNKGWGSPADVLTGYRHLENMLGADRAGRTVILPKDDQDVTAREALWTKLGWSKDAGAYKLAVPEGADPKFASDMAAMFSKHGVPVAAAQALTADWNAYMANATKGSGDLQAAAFAAESAQLDKDWGAERPARTELARRAAQQLGLTLENVAAIEKTTGFAGTMKAFAKIGDMLREHGAEGLTDPGSFGTTPEGAAVKKAQLMADSTWRQRAMDSKSAEYAELMRLTGIIASTKA